MTITDVAPFLDALDGDQPVGTDCEYDPAFVAMMAVLDPDTPGMNDHLVEDQQEDEEAQLARKIARWQTVSQHCTDLMQRTRDLRVDAMLALSLLHTEGIEGFCAGLNVTRLHMEKLWDTIHPILDPEDGKDPTARCNAFAVFEGHMLQLALDDLPIAHDPVGGSVTFEKMEIAAGRRSVDNDTAKSSLALQISDAFQHDGRDILMARASAARQAVEDCKAMEAFWAAQMSALTDWTSTEEGSAGRHSDFSQYLQFEQITETMLRIANHIESHLGIDSEDEEAGNEAVAQGQASGVSGAINSREDAARMLEKVADWFARNEPSSPVPLMVNRARQLISMSFIDIIEELGDSGMTEVKRSQRSTEEEG